MNIVLRMLKLFTEKITEILFQYNTSSAVSYLKMSVQVSLSLLFSLSFPLFLSQVSRSLFDLSTSTFYGLISLFPKLRTIKRNKQNITAGARVPTTPVKNPVEPETKEVLSFPLGEQSSHMAIQSK